MQRIALRVAGCVFLAVGLLHSWRALKDIEVTIGEMLIPTAWSTIGLVIAFGLAIWMFYASLK